MIYYKYMYTYSIYPPAAGRFETSQLTQQTTEKKKKEEKNYRKIQGEWREREGGREREGEKGRERERKKKEKK